MQPNNFLNKTMNNTEAPKDTYLLSTNVKFFHKNTPLLGG